MSDRTPLQNSIRLSEFSGNGQREFKDISVMENGTGASAICYNAVHGGMGAGVLKEFYPQRCALALTRDGDGQLVPAGDLEAFYRKYLEERERYLRPYRILLEIKSNPSGSELTNFIPAFELYRGCPSDGASCGTVYVWSPQPALRTFRSVLEEIHATLGSRPEEKLHQILRITKRLSNCVCLLHEKSLIHRDINPGNFGFQVHGNQVLTDTLTFFDVNTVSYIFEEDHAMVGSQGFMEPEAGKRPFNAQTDIYSIGATLFSAVVVTEETRRNGQHYSDGYFNRLEAMVAESELIQASGSNATAEFRQKLIFLRRKLTSILRGCLALRKNRYQCCEELLADLDEALEAWQTVASAGIPLSLEEEIALEKKRAKSVSALDMLFHFYEHPLYEDTDNNDELRVLLLGFGGYSWRYLDACLQMGQMIRQRLRVTVICKHFDLLRQYLSDRPALEEFFDVDGGIACMNPDEIYGYIRCIPEDPCVTRSGVYVPDSQKIREWVMEKSPHRIFISLGNEAMNVSVANQCAVVGGCTVCYASEDSGAGAGSGKLLPVPVRARLKDYAEYPDLERMAFNAHLVWKKNILAIKDSDIKIFQQDYYSGSSFSNVLSVKYKLHLAGVDIAPPGMTYYMAAEQYTKNVTRDFRDELIWMEHRRWVTEKLCDGWKCLENPDDCPVGDTKFRQGNTKLHTCLVRSRPDSLLEDLVKGHPEKWDTMSKKEYASLDSLDRVSVNLHRKYRRLAAAVRQQNSLDVSPIRDLLKNHPKLCAAFQEWHACVRDLVSGNGGRYRQYRKLRDNLTATARNCLPEKEKELRKKLADFDELFAPVLESYHYLNLKNNDVDLIDNIPFILTYDKKLELVIPYISGSFSELFENLTAATLANPEKITYLYAAETERALNPLRASLPRIASYAAKKGLRARFSLVLFLPDKLYFRRASLKEEIAAQSGGLLSKKQIECHPLGGKEPLPQQVIGMLQKKSASHSVALQYFDSSHNGLSGQLYGSGVYDAVEHFTLDVHSPDSVIVSDACAIKYISPQTAMTVADMMAFGLSLSQNGDQPEFYGDFQHLWNRYQKNTKAWKALCRMLGNYDEEHSILVEFSSQPRGESVQTNYKLPVKCFDAASRILAELLRCGLVEPGSRVNRVSDYCEITLRDAQNHADEFNALFRTHCDKLTQTDEILCFPRKTRNGISVVVKEDRLQVASFVFSSKYENYYDQYKSLLSYWNDHQYIFGLHMSDDGISFHYTSHSFKRLLTNGGKMLEIFVYHKLRQQGDFDDVVSGCKINWGSDFRTLNELDCVVTKGFRSVFVECKSTDLQAEYYYKLDSLVKTLGVNAIPVIVSDDCGNTSEELLRRGDDMGIVTVTDREQIQNIGITLLDILKQ